LVLKCFSHFSSLPVFLTAFHILQCVFLIFHDIHDIFLAIFQVLESAFLIL